MNLVGLTFGNKGGDLRTSRCTSRVTWVVTGEVQVRIDETPTRTSRHRHRRVQ